MKYFGVWESYEDMVNDFGARYYEAPEGVATDDEVLIAVYGCPGYEGYAFVLFERDGDLFSIDTSHCSCYGLEEGWEPEAETWEALRMRFVDNNESPDRYFDEWPGEFYARIREIIVDRIDGILGG